jgi:hypothetical protein
MWFPPYDLNFDESINTNWTDKGTLLSHTFTGLTNGSTNTFYVRVVTNSGTTLYLSGETKNGETVSVESIPYGNPSNLTKVSQLPENEKYTTPTGKKIRTVGDQWGWLQEDRYRTNAQPQYILMDHQEKRRPAPTVKNPTVGSALEHG